MEGIVLHVTYSGAQAEAFAREMCSGLRSEVLAEDGCLQYDYFLPLGQEDAVLLLEHWRDQAALEAHFVGEPMKKLKALKEHYGLETGIERFE